MIIEALPYGGQLYDFVLCGVADDAGADCAPLQLGTTYVLDGGQVDLQNPPGEARLYISTNNSGDCPAAAASFDVTALSVTSTSINELTVAFSYSGCGQPAVRGCLHVENLPNGQ